MKAATKQRLVEEAQTLAMLSVYLSLLLGGFTTYRRLILEEYRIAYFAYGYSLVEAVVLAKIIMIGRLLHVGEGFGDRPLIVPTLYKTVSFSLFVLVFTVFEHTLTGLIIHRDLTRAFQDLWHTGIHQILAQMIVLFVAFVPLFALWELGDVLGPDKLRDLFFKHRQAVTPSPPDDTPPRSA